MTGSRARYFHRNWTRPKRAPNPAFNRTRREAASSRAPLSANVRLCNPTRSSCMDLQAMGIEPRQGSTGQIAG